MEIVNSINTYLTPPEWIENLDSKILYSQEIQIALQFLLENTTWVCINPLKAKRAFFELSEICLPDLKCIKTYKKLLKLYPHLFPSNVKLVIKSSQAYRVHITEDDLYDLSPKFYDCYISPHIKVNPIEISMPEYSQQTLKAFAEYLHLETIPNDIDPVKLYILADDLGFDDLKKECLSLVKNSFALINLPHLVQVSLDHEFKELFWLAISCASKINGDFFKTNPNEFIKSPMRQLDRSSCSPEVRKFIEIISKLSWKEVEFREEIGDVFIHNFEKIYHDILLLNELGQFTDYSLTIESQFFYDVDCIWSQLKHLKSFNVLVEWEYFEHVLEYVQYLAEVPLTYLNLHKIEDLTDQQLQELAEKKPNLKKLMLGNCPKITLLPFKQLEEFHCYYCPNLKEISLKHAKFLGLAKCSSRTKIDVPSSCSIKKGAIIHSLV